MQFGNVTVEENVLLAPFTTFKIGGPARYFVRTKSIAETLTALSSAEEKNLPIYILGGGSNMLVHDSGFDGLVIKLENNSIEFTEHQVTAGAGALLNAVIMAAMQRNLQGLEFAVGVPASVGGAVWANLGCRGSEISAVLESVQACDRQGNLRTLGKADCRFGYRDSIFKHEPLIILSATFTLQPGDKTELRKKLVELTKLKKSEQNVGEDTAGCTFRNPDSGKNVPRHVPTAVPSAGELIESIGLMGFQIGGAKVSTKHANFILNVGNATADDVVQLVSYVKQQVRDKCGVQLMEEIEYVGF